MSFNKKICVLGLVTLILFSGCAQLGHSENEESGIELTQEEIDQFTLYLDKGNEFFLSKEWELAQEEYYKAYRIYQDSASILYVIFRTHWKLQELDQANDFLKQLLFHEEEFNSLVYYHAAQFLFNYGKYFSALKFATIVDQRLKNENDPELLIDNGKLLVRINQAIGDFKKARDKLDEVPVNDIEFAVFNWEYLYVGGTQKGDTLEPWTLLLQSGDTLSSSEFFVKPYLLFLWGHKNNVPYQDLELLPEIAERYSQLQLISIYDDDLIGLDPDVRSAPRQWPFALAKDGDNLPFTFQFIKRDYITRAILVSENQEIQFVYSFSDSEELARLLDDYFEQ